MSCALRHCASGGRSVVEKGDRDGNRGAVRVVSMGTDTQEDHALLCRLRAVAGVSDTAICLCDDPHACDVLVVRDTSAMRGFARDLAGDAAGVRLWILDEAGSLHDERAPDAAFDEATLWHALDQLLGPGVATPLPLPVAEPAADVALAVADASPASARELDALPIAQALRESIIAGKGHATLLHAGQPLLLLDFDRRLAIAASATTGTPALAAELSALLAGATLRPLDAATFNARSAAALPLIPLLWNVAMQARGETALLPPLAAGTALSLRQWPDFRAVANRPDHFQLCSLLLKRPSTASEAATLLGVSADVVQGFYNAAYVTGYAVADAPASARANDRPAADEAANSRLSRLWRTVLGDRRGS